MLKERILEQALLKPSLSMCNLTPGHVSGTGVNGAISSRPFGKLSGRPAF
jgi:hypothetical protein